MKKRVLALLVAVVMLVGVFAACGGGGNDSSTPTSSSGNSETASSETGSTGGEESTPETSNTGTAGPADTSEHIEVQRYSQYDWVQIKPWGGDMTSRALEKKFNITLNDYKPDADSDSRFALMLNDKSWPEAVCLTRTNYLPRLIEVGGAVEISQFYYDGSYFTDSIGELTREIESVDGKNYCFGVWSRSGLQGKGCTGGNYYWQINPKYYEAVGSPPLNTLDDYEQFALKVKEANLTSYDGLSVQPIFLFHYGNGKNLYWPISRSLGLENIVDDRWAATWKDGKSTVEFLSKNEKFVEAIKIANRWYNEGLFSADTFSNDDNLDYSFLATGRAALAWVDFSQDNTWNYRRLLTEASGDPKDTYEVIGAEGPSGYDLTEYPFFPHEDGVVVYGDINGVGASSVNVITPLAVEEGVANRLYDLFGFMLSKEFSAWAQWGPPSVDAAEGDAENCIYDEYDADGIPQINMNLDELTSTKSDQLGAWFWTGMGPINADYVDALKFGVDAQQPEGHHDFTAYIQTQVSSTKESATEGQKLVSIEWENMSDSVETSSDLGAQRQALYDKFDQLVPQMIQASDEATIDSLLQELNDYYDTQGGPEIQEAYQAVVDKNVETQGYSVLDPAFGAYDVKK